MSKKFTKGQLLDLLSDKLAHQMSKMALEQIREGLELRLEALDTDDLFDARAAAQQDIEQEFGTGEFPEFGSMENPKSFVHSIDNAPQKGADTHASAWQEHYADFNDKITTHLTNDPKLAEFSAQNPHEFLDAMATAMYKYMMDHNSSSPFISSIQQWIIDLNDQFDPTDEETGEVEMDPASWRMYKLLGTFEKDYNRSVLKKKVAHAAAVPLKEQRELLESALVGLNEAREWSHSPEAYDAARQNLHILPHDILADIMSEWDAYEAAGGDGSVMAADFDAVDASKYEKLPVDVLADAIFEKAEQLRTCDNGGHLLWMCPYGCNTHKVKPDHADDMVDEAGPYAPMMRGKHDSKQTYDWEVVFFDKMNSPIATPKKTPILNKSYKEALRDAKAMMSSVDGAVDVDIQEKHRDLRYEYTINLDERGLFYASVQDEDGKTVYEIKTGYGEEEDNNVFENGYMKHKHDLDGLEQHLKSMGIMEPDGYDDFRDKDSGATLVASFGKGRRAMNEDLDDMDIDGGSLTDDPESVNSTFRVDDVSHGFYVMPPTATDPRWYVVNNDGEPVADYDTEEEANAAIPGLEAQSVTPEPQDGTYGSVPQFGIDFKEGRLDRMEALLNEADALLKEYGSNIPMGANTMDAPWNAAESVPVKQKPKSVFSLVDKDDDCLIFHHGGEYYAMPLEGMMPDTVREIAIDFVGVPELGPDLHDASEYSSASHLPAEAIVDYVNDNVGRLSIGAGVEAWESGMDDLVKVDHALVRLLKAEYPRLSVPIA